MPDVVTLAAVLLIVGPLLGAVPIANPALLAVWSASREEHLRIVGAHRVGWSLLNAGFTFATVLTAAGLTALAVARADAGDAPVAAALGGTAVAYATGGVLWCAVQGIRMRLTPLLADLVARGEGTEPAESLLGAATGGMFTAFAWTTSATLVALGVVLLAGGIVAAPVGWVAIGVGVLAAVVLVRTGDLIPAVLYLPTLLLGIALLAGWS